MKDALLFVILIVLTFSVAINLLLTFRIGRVVRERRELISVPKVAIGRALPYFEGIRSTNRNRITSIELTSQPLVFAFLSSHCPACRMAADELSRLLGAMHAVGVALWIVVSDRMTDEVSQLLANTLLLDHLIILEEATVLRLNPSAAVPFYIFANEGLIPQASGYIGDEDWQSFVGQVESSATVP